MTRYLFLLLLLVPCLCDAQSFVTKVSATTIGKKDVLQIEYIGEDVVMEQFTLPRFNKWTVVSGPNLSSSTTQMGNVIKQHMVYSVMVQPNATGFITVPGATALINNKPMRSNVVMVQVKNLDHTGNNPPAQAPKTSLFDQFPLEDEVPSNQYLKKGEKAIDKIKNNIVVRLEVNKRSCFVGEPILATYKLCTRLRSKSKVVKQPQFSGCTVVELTGDDQDQHIEKINGVEYNVFVIRKVQLVPLAPGSLVLPPTSVENRVSFYNASNLSYRDLYYGNATVPVDEQLVTLQNKPAMVEVKALPPFPSVGGTDFSGAIGKFEVEISGEGALTTNNTNQLLVTIQGEGNLQQVKPPLITWPKGLEAFEVKEHEEDDKSGFPVKSKKVFAFPFIADKKGNYTIPPAALTYFDPNLKKYVTKNTHTVTLQIAPGSKKFFGASGIVNNVAGFQNRLYILLGAGFLAIVIGLVWFNGKQKVQPQAAAAPNAPKVEKQQPVLLQRDASEFLFNIRELQPDIDRSFFYKLLCKNLQSYLSSKYNIVPGQLPFYIEQHPQKEAALLQFKRLLDNCSLGMYTPLFTIEEAMQHRLDAIQVLSQLEKEI